MNNTQELNIKNMEDIYIVKHNSKIFEPNTLVKFITCSDSGKCYLVEEINSDKREWVMYYDLYPVDFNKHNFKHKWFYNKETEDIINILLNAKK